MRNAQALLFKTNHELKFAKRNKGDVTGYKQRNEINDFFTDKTFRQTTFAHIYRYQHG